MEDFNDGLRKKNFNVLLEKINFKRDIVSNLVQIYREHLPNINLYSDARTAIKKIHNKKNLGIITDGHVNTQKNKIRVLDIEKYFNYIIINDIRKDSKLEQRPFEKMLLKLNSKPNESIYVGDNPLRDFIVSKKMGIHTVRIQRKNGIYEDTVLNKDDDAKYIIKNLMKLFDIIEEI